MLALQTLRLQTVLRDQELVNAKASLRSLGADTVELVSTHRFGLTYGMLESERLLDTRRVLKHFPDARLYEWAVIALAIEPAVPDALPILQNAFAGAGRPSGVVECRLDGAALVIEFRPDQASPQILFALLDAELARFGSHGRTTTLLSPLPPMPACAVAASGLRAADLTTDRILDVLIESSDA